MTLFRKRSDNRWAKKISSGFRLFFYLRRNRQKHLRKADCFVFQPMKVSIADKLEKVGNLLTIRLSQLIQFICNINFSGYLIRLLN